MPNRGTVRAEGIARISRALTSRGWTVNEFMDGRKTLLQANRNSRSVRLFVKSKTKGNWHTDIREGVRCETPPKDEAVFWAFTSQDTPEIFWIVPDWWMRNDIYRHHAEYLASHNGQRRDNNASTHSDIREHEIEQWIGRWEILD